MKKLVKYTTSIIVLATSLGWSSTIAANAEERDTPVTEIAKISSLTPEQKEAVNAYVAQGREASAKEQNLGEVSTQENKPMRTAHASYYRGSALMWTRDNVDFSYSDGQINWSSGYQEAGAIFPNIARNKGINRFDQTSRQHSWRAHHTIGAGIVTPWGDVIVYTWDVTNRINVYGNGRWYAWAES